jgi:hypothetical protein
MAWRRESGGGVMAIWRNGMAYQQYQRKWQRSISVIVKSSGEMTAAMLAKTS